MSDNNDNDLFERLNLDGSLRRTFSIYCKGFVTFTKLAFAVFAVGQTVWMVLLPLLKASFGLSGSDFSDREYHENHSGAYWTIREVYYVLHTVTTAVGEGTMIKAAADIYLRREPDFVACIRVGARKGCALVSASFLARIGIHICHNLFVHFLHVSPNGALFWLLFLIPGYYLSVIWFLVHPVIVVEGCSIFASLERSRDLVSGSWCYTFCTFVIVYIPVFVFELVLVIMVTGGDHHVFSHSMLSGWGSHVVAIPSVAWMPIFAIMRTIIYINLRVEKEGLNAEMFARDLGEGGGDVSYRQITLMGEEEDTIQCSDV